MRGTVLGLVTIILLSWGMVSPSLGDIAYYNLFVVSDGDGSIHQLIVSPNGQVIDPHIQYVVGGNTGFGIGEIAVTNNYQFLLASPGEPGTFCFQILPNGNLLEVSSTSVGTGKLVITPDDQLVIMDNSIVYTLSSTGNLIYDTTGPYIIENLNVDPFGRGIIGWSSHTTFSIYTINYSQGTLTMTTTYPLGNGNYFEFSFTPNGKLGFVSGIDVSPNGGNLWVLNIDSVFNVTTTSEIFSESGNVVPGIPAISLDSKYLWLPMGFIELFSIDTLENVTDTGQKYYVSNMSTERAAYLQKNTPDGRMAVVQYDDFSGNSGNFATAVIAGNGSLLWTGYTFSTNYGDYITDFVIVPVYTTSIPEELWGKLDEK